MKKMVAIICLAASSIFNISQADTNLLNEIKRNFNNADYGVQLGNYLHNKSEKEKLIVREALRHTYITSSMNRESAMNLLIKSSLIDLKEKDALEDQLITYEEIVNKFRNNTENIDKKISYTTYRCTGIENRLTDMMPISPFKRNLRISDVSSNQDFLQFKNRNDVVITHVPTANEVINHVRTNTRIKFINIEEKIISNNATSASMYVSVSNGKYTYLMFPFKFQTEDHENLSDLTIRQYAYFALNLSLTGRLTPEIYKTMNRIYARNASLCLYANE